MTDDIETNLVYKEGYTAHDDGISCINNPYEGVSESLAKIWHDAWWDAWYKDYDSYED